MTLAWIFREEKINECNAPYAQQQLNFIYVYFSYFFLSVFSELIKNKGKEASRNTPPPPPQPPTYFFLPNESHVVFFSTCFLGKLRNLKTKTEEMRAQVTCKVCLERSVGFVFLPCGHMVCCEDCAWVMRECPVCRKDIKGMIKSSFGD